MEWKKLMAFLQSSILETNWPKRPVAGEDSQQGPGGGRLRGEGCDAQECQLWN